jgi:hypothetical protein
MFAAAFADWSLLNVFPKGGRVQLRIAVPSFVTGVEAPVRLEPRRVSKEEMCELFSDELYRRKRPEMTLTEHADCQKTHQIRLALYA